MQGDELPAVDPDVDYTQILPIQQKRTIAFVNQFLMNTVSYLNKFAQSCESRFMEFEYKLQKVEASLLILESQLSSIDGLEKSSELSSKSEPTSSNESALELPVIADSSKQKEQEIQEEQKKSITNGIKICEHPDYQKFFKMIRVGVQEEAVKLKMQSEGFDPDILNTPNEILPAPPPTVDNSDSASSS